MVKNFMFAEKCVRARHRQSDERSVRVQPSEASQLRLEEKKEIKVESTVTVVLFREEYSISI